MSKKSSMIQFRLDSELKEKAEEVFNQLGLTFSSAYILFTQAVVNHRKIPFEVSLPKETTKSFPYNSENLINSEGKPLVNLNERFSREGEI